MRVVIETIAHEDQRYDTIGDWEFKGEELSIKVSETGEEDYNFLIAVHELGEAWLCRARGIEEEKVSAFDKAFNGPGEPGDDIKAPYRDEHCIATGFERMLCGTLALSWEEYEVAVDSL